MVAASRLLGQILLASGGVRTTDLESALDEQRASRERLGVILIRKGAEPEQIARALATQLHLEFAPAPLRPAADALALVDGPLAARLRVVPLALVGQRLRVAMADPLDGGATDDLRFRTGRRIEAVVATPAAVDTALAAYHARAVDALLERLPDRDFGAATRNANETPELKALRRASEAAPIIALVDHVLSRAVKLRGSDVHIEPGDGGLRVRVRVDGVLRPVMELPGHTAGAIASRIKIMADLDIAVKRRPQDGRATLVVEGKELTFRVSTLPANGGEKLVLRILDPDGAAQPLEALGMGPSAEAEFRRLLSASHGVILVTGPTGSGKTTTLYGALSTLDREGRNIITLEDPVEYRLPGVTQVQVHRRAGLGFASALRAVLRQDPDIVMVGELRDRETVETAMAAALTGHLVLATLHTNDAPTAATRLAEMGAAPYLVAGGLIGVLAQRLARRLCPHCAQRRPPDPGELGALGLPPFDGPLAAPAGCARCDNRGYRGRTGIFELLTVGPEIRSLILKRAPADAIRRAAREGGMSSLGSDAWHKVQSGLTTLEEVRPLLALLGAESERCPMCSAEVRSAFTWCPDCGASLRQRCPCGARLAPTWRMCPRCGETVSRRASGGVDSSAPRRSRG
jgi:type IV pilus assembly protein PilB